MAEVIAACLSYPTDSHKESAVLILTRMEGEKVMIGDDITIVFAGFNRDQVKLGIEAPRDIAVMREELLEREWS